MFIVLMQIQHYALKEFTTGFVPFSFFLAQHYGIKINDSIRYVITV